MTPLVEALRAHNTSVDLLPDYPLLEAETRSIKSSFAAAQGRLIVKGFSQEHYKTHVPKLLDQINSQFIFYNPTNQKERARDIQPSAQLAGANVLMAFNGVPSAATFMAEGKLAADKAYDPFDGTLDKYLTPADLTVAQSVGQGNISASLFSDTLTARITATPELGSLLLGLRVYLADQAYGDIFMVEKASTKPLVAMIPDAAEKSIKVIKYQKIKKEFVRTEISVEEYLNNPNSYIALTTVWRNGFTYSHAPRYSQAVNATYQYKARVLMVPKTMLKEQYVMDLVAFLRALNENQLELFLESQLRSEYIANAGVLAKHWTGFAQILSGVDPKVLATLNVASDVDKADKSTLSGVANGIAKLTADPKVREVKTTFREVRAKTIERGETWREVQTASARVRETEELASRCAREIASLQARVKQNEETAAGYATVKPLHLAAQKTSQERLKNIQEEEAVLVGKASTSLQTLQGAIDLSNTAEKLDCYITGLRFQDGSSYSLDLTSGLASYFDAVTSREGLQVPVADTAPLLARIIAAEIPITSATLVTTKPVLMAISHFDTTKEKKEIVGGPYRIQLTTDPAIGKVGGHVFLASNSAVFGINPKTSTVFELKQHPHSASYTFNKGDVQAFQNFIKAPTKACFGEVEAPLAAAMKAGDMEMMRRLVYNWLSNAWDGDRWGATFVFFRSPKQIELEKMATEVTSETE